MKNTIFKTHKYGSFKVIKELEKDKNYHRRYLIEFIEYPYKKVIARSELRSKKIRNPYYPIIHDIACQGEKYNSKHFLYSRWRSMIKRCYEDKDKNYKSYGGRGVRVCDRWLCFENYVDDALDINGYDESLVKCGILNLDKDIIGDGFIYDKKSCIWGSRE